MALAWPLDPVPLLRGKSFTDKVFDDQARRLHVYSNRGYIRGVLPPATLTSDDAVKRFVVQEPSAIGYIDAKRMDKRLRALFYVTYP